MCRTLVGAFPLYLRTSSRDDSVTEKGVTSTNGETASSSGFLAAQRCILDQNPF